MEPNVVVIVPAHNEEANITHILGQLKSSVDSGVVSKVVVVANGCTDKTVDLVRKLSVPLIVDNIPNKGNAIIRGTKWAHKNKGNIIVTIDADTISVKPEQIKILIDPVVKGVTPMSVANASSPPQKTFIQPKYSGFRAISIKALNPVLAGNPTWIKDLTTGPYGVETALNAKLLGKKYIYQGVDLPEKVIAKTNFATNRKPTNPAEVARNVYDINLHLKERKVRAEALKEQLRKRRILRKQAKHFPK